MGPLSFGVDADVAARVTPVGHRIQIDECEVAIPWAVERTAWKPERLSACDGRRCQIDEAGLTFLLRQLRERCRTQVFNGQRHGAHCFIASEATQATHRNVMQVPRVYHAASGGALPAPRRTFHRPAFEPDCSK